MGQAVSVYIGKLLLAKQLRRTSINVVIYRSISRPLQCYCEVLGRKSQHYDGKIALKSSPHMVFFAICSILKFEHTFDHLGALKCAHSPHQSDGKMEFQ